MKKIIVTLILIILISGCSSYSNTSNPKGESNLTLENKDNQSIKTIVVSGTDKYQYIEGEEIVNVDISGVRNEVIFREGTPINEIRISGIDISVYIPEGTSPNNIMDSGINTNIEYMRPTTANGF